MKITLGINFLLAVIVIAFGIYVDTTAKSGEDKFGSTILYAIGGLLFAVDLIGALIYLLVKA